MFFLHSERHAQKKLELARRVNKYPLAVYELQMDKDINSALTPPVYLFLSGQRETPYFRADIDGCGCKTPRGT